MRSVHRWHRFGFWTRPIGVGWKAKGPKIDCRHQSVKSVLSSDGGQSVVKVAEIGKNLPEYEKSHQILQKKKKNAEICWDLARSGLISLELVEISPDLAGSPHNRV